jgi:hypothetical protein
MLRKMKRSIIFLLMSCFAVSGLSAQEKGLSVKIGGGVNVILQNKAYVASASHSLGPAVAAECTYQFNPWFSAGLNVHSSSYKSGKFGVNQDFDGALRGYLRPLGSMFRYLEVGMGVTGLYRNTAGVVSYTYDSDGMEGTIYCAVKNDIGYVGIDLPVRLYLIDNSRFQLMMFYDFKTLFMEKQHFWNYSVGGIMFGIRF